LDERSPGQSEEDRPLVLDEVAERLDRFAALRDTDSAVADAVLDELGATSDVDRDIVVQLAGQKPLAYPERFGESPCPPASSTWPPASDPLADLTAGRSGLVLLGGGLLLAPAVIPLQE
jgi:hypothetical protein